MDLEKHCDTCAYSYRPKSWKPLSLFYKPRQHCNCPEYNSPEYTSEIFLEDRGHDYCRFWTPREEAKYSWKIAAMITAASGLPGKRGKYREK